MRPALLAAAIVLIAPATAQQRTDDLVATMRATLVHGPQKVQLAGAALEPFKPLFREARQDKPVFAETSVVSRKSTQPPCGRVNARLTPVGITGKSPVTGHIEQIYWDVAYDLCADDGATPDALARASNRSGASAAPNGLGLTQ